MTDNGSTTFHRIATVVTAVALLATSGCSLIGEDSPGSSGTTSTARTAVGFAQFPDIAVPAGSTMNVDRSLILGARDSWIGRLSLDTSASSAVAYDFFLREMPKYRWREVTTVRSEISILTFTRDKRVATIQITKKALGGSAIDVTVSPSGRSASEAMPADASRPGTP
ncbi:MAG: hypothetical protein VYA17_08355 [Pseudomonadota bacterium]|nr:hypothetical protein [Pseudomonadota bacterium]